jgi:hypothetical protein
MVGSAMKSASYTENWPDPLHRGGCGCQHCAKGDLDRIVRRTMTVAQRHAQSRFDGLEQDAADFWHETRNVTEGASSAAGGHYGNLIVVPKPATLISDFLSKADREYKGPNRQWVYRFFLRPSAAPGCQRLTSPFNRPFYIGRVSRQSVNGLKDRVNEHLRRGRSLLVKMNSLRNKIKTAADAVSAAQQYRAGKPVFGTKISGSQLFDFILASLEQQFCVQVSEVCLGRGTACKAPPGASLLVERAHIFRDNAHINRPYEEEDEDELADAIANLTIVDLRQ